MAYECRPQYLQSLNFDDVQILESLSIDGDCRVVEGMDGEVVAFEEPRKKKLKVPRKEKTYKSMMETPHLNIILTTYY